MIPVRDTIPCASRPVITWSIIIINTLIFLYIWTMPEELINRLFYVYGMVPARYSDPAWAEHVGLSVPGYWSLVTHMFLHGGALHLIMNMWILWIFGDNIEDLMGPVRFIAFYLICGLVGALLQYLYNPATQIPTVGASAAIAGTMGAYFVLYPYARVVLWIPILFLPLFIEVPAIAFLGVWVIFQLSGATTAVTEPGGFEAVAWWGHLGGFVAGALLYRLFMKPREQNI